MPERFGDAIDLGPDKKEQGTIIDSIFPGDQPHFVQIGKVLGRELIAQLEESMGRPLSQGDKDAS